MKVATLLSLTAVLAVCCSVMTPAAEAATIWNGPKFTFKKFRIYNPLDPAYQDRLTPNVWLTRATNQSLFNIRRENGFNRPVSPADTEWAYGTTADLPNLTFTPWSVHNNQCSPCQVGRDAVVHLISEDIYIDIKMLSWEPTSGNTIYERSTPSDGVSPVVEYYHTTFKHFFYTTHPFEAVAMDARKELGGWTRTGQLFPVITDPAAGKTPVCRFRGGVQFEALDTNFYTVDANECIQYQRSDDWRYDGDAFFADLPVGATCPSGTTPLHRVFNRSLSGAPNHRLTACTNIRDRMITQGWLSQGVAMCVAGNSFDCNSDASFATRPGSPLDPAATAGNASLTVTFKPPLSDGNAAITSYTATCTGGGVTRKGSNTASPVTVRGFRNGILQRCTVVATNEVGDGPTSTFALTTPTAGVNLNINTLPIPPLLEPTVMDGIYTYDLTVAPSAKQFLPGAPTATYGFNGHDFWGPTILMKKGDMVQMRVTNLLPDDTTNHWHGPLLNGYNDGGPQVIIPVGSTWVTEPFPVKNQASTLWYHPHRHEFTQKQLTLGAGGLIIVRDEEEAALALPRTYGVDDIPVVLTSRRFVTIDGVPNQLDYEHSVYGDVMLTNSTLGAQYTLPRQMVRLRVLNAEIQREYNIGFSDGRTFHVIGTDGGLLSAPVPMKNLIIAPAERYEIIVDLTNDDVGLAISLEAHNGPDAGLKPGFAGLENATSGELGSLLNNRTFTLLRINVGAPTSDAITTLPAKLAENTGLAALTLENAVNGTEPRRLGINRGEGGNGGLPNGPFTFNALPFDMDRIDQSVALGTTEAWTVGSGDVISHSFHIHGVQALLVARNGDPAKVGDWEKGWKDTFFIPKSQNITFVTRFDETADAAYPFMYHCHMIKHEDQGLMGQFTVQ